MLAQILISIYITLGKPISRKFYVKVLISNKNIYYNLFDCFTPANHSHCQPNPCVHGSCVEITGGYSCTCNSGYTGKNCDTGKVIVVVITMLYDKKITVDLQGISCSFNLCTYMAYGPFL